MISNRSWELEAKSARRSHLSFAQEAIKTNHTYPQNRHFLSITKQIEILSKYFPTLNINCIRFDKIKNRDYLDGVAVFVNWNKLRKSYNQLVVETLEYLPKTRKNFINPRQNELSSEYLRLTKRTEKKLEKLLTHDFIALPIQLGRIHLGKSARQAYVDFLANEFGLGPLEISCFLLTHPDWLSSDSDLGIDCVGCEYGPFRHGFFRYILFFYHNKDLRFDTRWCGCPDVRFGPATGFINEYD